MTRCAVNIRGSGFDAVLLMMSPLCASLAFQELESFEDLPQEGEKVSTITSTVEPSTGDKRPREDDTEQQANQAPASRSPQGAGSGSGNSNGAYSGNPMVGVQMGNPGGQGYDALYIGDLQWVRGVVSLSIPSLRLGSLFCIVLCSGRLMKTYVKWP